MSYKRSISPASRTPGSWKFLPTFLILWLLTLGLEALLLDEVERRKRGPASTALSESVTAVAEKPPAAKPDSVASSEASLPPVKRKRSAEVVPSMEPAEVPDSELVESRPPVPEEKSVNVAEVAAQVDAMYPMPEIRPLMEIVDNWNQVPQSAFPKSVTINVPVDLELLQDGERIGQSTIPVGSLVVPQALDGEILTVSTVQKGAAAATVRVDQTDFKQRVRERYEGFSNERVEHVITQRKTELQRRLKSIAHEEALSAYNPGDDPRFGALKESLQRGDAGFFELEAASKWRWAGKESIDGVEYETAYAIMVTESAFGTAEREIKAMIRDGEVAKWIDVASGEEL